MTTSLLNALICFIIGFFLPALLVVVTISALRIIWEPVVNVEAWDRIYTHTVQYPAFICATIFLIQAFII